MRVKLIEEKHGTGWLTREHDEAKVLDVEYSIEIYQEMRDIGGGREIEGLKRIEGTVNPAQGDPHGIALAPLVGESLVLHMEGGQKLGMFITNSRTGSIANRTGFF